jgi:hypothetical protein
MKTWLLLNMVYRTFFIFYKVTPHFNLKKYSTEAGLLQGITNDVNPSNGGATHIGSGLKVRKT